MKQICFPITISLYLFETLKRLIIEIVHYINSILKEPWNSPLKINFHVLFELFADNFILFFSTSFSGTCEW